MTFTLHGLARSKMLESNQAFWVCGRYCCQACGKRRWAVKNDEKKRWKRTGIKIRFFRPEKECDGRPGPKHGSNFVDNVDSECTHSHGSHMPGRVTHHCHKVWYTFTKHDHASIYTIHSPTWYCGYMQVKGPSLRREEPCYVSWYHVDSSSDTMS